MNILALVFALAVLLDGTPEPQDIDRPYRTYLPAALNERETNPIPGTQDETGGVYRGYYLPGQLVHVNVRWDLAEPSPGQYAWAKVDKQIRNINGVKLIVGTRAAPGWARKYGAWTCSQPAREYYDEYTQFLVKLIERYNPWGVELWNEPDVSRDGVEKNWYIFGCWDSGAEYAAMTWQVVRDLKRAYPDVKVLVGALMMDDNTQGWDRQFLTSKPAGDYVSFHAYSVSGVTDTYNIAGEKADWIRQYTSMPLIATEVSFLDWSENCVPAYQSLKAKHVQRVATKADDWGLSGWLWYTIGGNNWKCSDLHPGPAYDAFRGLFK